MGGWDATSLTATDCDCDFPKPSSGVNTLYTSESICQLWGCLNLEKSNNFCLLTLSWFFVLQHYRAEQMGLVTLYTCMHICMRMSSQKANRKEENISWSLYTSVLKDVRFSVAVLFPALTVSGNEWVQFRYLIFFFRYQSDQPSSI